MKNATRYYDKMDVGLHVKYPLFLSEFNEFEFFLENLKKNTQILNLMKICPVGAELFHAGKKTERWADGKMTKLVVTLRSLANGPKNKL